MARYRFRTAICALIALLAAAPGALAQFSTLRITTNSLPKGTVGSAYSAQLAATGGKTPYAWAVTSGALPAGLSLKASTGAITGTPTAAANVSLTFRVTDSSRLPQRKSVSLTLTIAATTSPLAISTTSLSTGQVGTAYSAQLSAAGGKTPYVWSLTGGTLPGGLTLSASGALTGTPTATANATPLTFTVKDSSSPAQTKSASLALTIAAAVPPLSISTTSLPGGQVGSPYSAQLSATGGTPPYSWSMSGGALPSGVTLASGGELSGTPTPSGSFSASFQVTDSSSPKQTAQASLAIQVSAASGPSGVYGSGINADSLNNVTVGPHPAVSYRFLANHSGLVQQLHFYLIDTSTNTGYDAGTGGTLSIQLETDDGTSAHNPSGVVLASGTIPNPKANFPEVVLSSQPQLYAGSLYHVVFTNTDPNPTVNYVSVDDLYMYVPQQPAMQPAFSDTNWATLIENQSGWSIYRYNTPILEVDYTDGASQGNGYMEVWVGAPDPISGNEAVREQFTVSGNDQNVSSVSIRLARMSGSDNLTVRLEQADGTLIEQGTIPASNFSLPSGSTAEYTWGTYTFSTSYTLSVGQGYHLVLEAPSTSTYQAYPIRKGVSYQFQPTTYFPDGYAQFSTDGSTWAGWTQWGVTNRTDGDLQFYFSTIP